MSCNGRAFDNVGGRFCFPALSTLVVDSASRLDKWLWAVRIFKSRSLASDACRAGSVAVNEFPAKPARDVHPGETVTAHEVTIHAPLNLPATLPVHSSQMYSRNVAAFLALVLKDGALQPDSSTVHARILGHDVTYKLGAPGRHMVDNSLGVLAAASLLGADLALAALPADQEHRVRCEQDRERVAGRRRVRDVAAEPRFLVAAAARSRRVALRALPPGAPRAGRAAQPCRCRRPRLCR
mgnify:CR=1 FL=1